MERWENSLSEIDRELIKTMLYTARIRNIKDLASYIGVYLSYKVQFADDISSFKTTDEFPELKLRSHQMTTGMPGTGKTVLANEQAVRLLKANDDISIHIVDTEGDRAPYIISKLEEVGLSDRWLYFDEHTIQENMFELAEYDPDWFAQDARNFCEFGYYGDTGEPLMRNEFTDANAEAERNRKGGWLTYNEAVSYVKQSARKAPSKSKRQQYLTTISERLALWEYSIGSLFNSRKSVPWEFMKHKCVIWDLRNKDHLAQLFFQNYLLMKLLFIRSRIETEDRSQILFDIDELHRFINSAQKKESLHAPFIIEAARTSRKRGIFISYKDQFFSTPPKELIGSCNTIICFRMKDQDCRRKAEKELNLTSDQTAELGKLPNRNCIYITKNEPEARLCEVPELDMENLLTHDQIRELMKGKLPESEEPKFAQKPTPTMEVDTTELAKLKQLLQAISSNTAKPLETTRNELGWPKPEFTRLVKLASKSNLITDPESVRLGQKGRGKLYAEILKQGAEFIGANLEDIQIPGGKNKTLQSKVMVFELASKFAELGYGVHLEHRGCDLLVSDQNNLFTAYEIETSPIPHIATNIQRDLEQIDPAKVVIVMVTKEDLEIAKEKCAVRLTEEQMRRVEFKQIKELLEE